MRKELRKHKIIGVHTKDNVCLFINRYFSWCCKFCKNKNTLTWNNRKKITKLFKLSKYRIEQDLNIIKLVKNFKIMNVLMKNSILTEDSKY